MSRRLVARWLAVLLAFNTAPPVMWSGETPLADTQRATVGTNVSSDAINNLPTSGRSFTDLATLVPGVVATKEGPRDSVNWDRVPGGQRALDAAFEQLPVITGGASAQYGRYDTGGVINAITKSGGSASYGDFYTQTLNSREWPGESQGYGGTLIGIGRSGREPAATFYTDHGVPQLAFNRTDLRKGKRRIINYLDDMCELMTQGDYMAGKMVVSDLNSGKVSTGKLTAEDTYADYDRLMGPGPLQQFRKFLEQFPTASSTPSPASEYGLPSDYKYRPTLTLDYGFGSEGSSGGGYTRIPSYGGGGMQQIDPPATDSGVVTDQAIRDATNKQKDPKVRDAINQYLTPNQPPPPEPSDETKPRSWLDPARRWARALGRWVSQPMIAEAKSGSGLWSASSTDANGTTTAHQKQPDGSVQRTVTDRNGNIKEQGPLKKPEPTKVKPREPVTRASATDENGNTTTVEKKDGVTTRTVTDAQGGIVERGVVEAPPQTKVPPRVPGTTHASATDENGNTISIDRHPDGSSTLKITDAQGRTIQEGPLTAPPPTTVPPRTPGHSSASGTDENGNTIKVDRKPDGSGTRTVTAPDGRVIESGPITKPEPTTVPPRDPVTRASATDENGNTTTVTRDPKTGATTRTVTDRNGNVTESGPVTTPPPTTAPPRDSATSVSVRNPDGSMTTIAKQPDGSTVRTVTDRNGNVTERTPIAPPEVTKVPPRVPGTTRASSTDSNGNTLTIDRDPKTGTVTRTVTDRDGNVIQQGTVPPPEPTIPKKKEPSAPFVSTVDAQGNTVMIKREPNGTMTQTVTNPAGDVIHQGAIEPPPVTKTPPRQPGYTSASATLEDGRTISVVRQPNGTTTRTVTGPDGKVIEHTTTGGPAQPAQPLNPTQPATFGLDFKESTGVIAGIGGKVELAPEPPKPPTPKDPSVLEFRGSEEALDSLMWKPSIGSTYDWTRPHPPVSPLPGPQVHQQNFGGGLGHESWWNQYYQTSDHLPVKADYQGAPQTTPQQQSAAPTTPNYLEHFALGVEYEIQGKLRMDLAYQDPATDRISTGEAFNPYAYGTLRFGYVPWNEIHSEAGLGVGDTRYSNFGTYPAGERPLITSGKKKITDELMPPSIRMGNQEFTYGQPPRPVTGAPHVRGFTGAEPGAPSVGGGHVLQPFQPLPQWQPEQLIVLPWGCTGGEKEDFLDDLYDFWDGGPAVFGMEYNGEVLIFFNDEAQVVPNDPLYDVGEEARHRAESEHKAEERRRQPRGGDLSMAAPAGAGPSDIALSGPSHAKKKTQLSAQDQWGLRSAGFGEAWAIEGGEQPNTIVAIIDSGLDLSHPDGPAHLWTNPKETPGNGLDDDGNGYVDDVHGWNFLDENHDLRDTRGHGTLVAGIIAAKRNNGQGIAGINPGARIMVLKVSDSTRRAHSLNLYRALRYAAANGARVINISLGSPGRSRLVQLGINYAHARGAVVVVAAGNEAGQLGDHEPGSSRRTLTVAALGMNGARSAISNGGVNLGLTAPGQEIYSLHSKDAEWPGPAMQRERLYRAATGTSFSAPMVAATASLILAKRPKLPPAVVEDILLNSAVPIEGEGWNPSTGTGRLDAAKALAFDLNQLVTILPEEVVVRQNKKRVEAVELYGTIRGVFTTYQLELGKGGAPSSWKPLGGPQADPAEHELLCRIPAEELKGSNAWVVRITATGKRGQRRVAHVPIGL